MIGPDAGFFVVLVCDNCQAAALCERLTAGELEALVSRITLLEIERLALREAISRADVLVEGIRAVCRIYWIETREVPSRAARISRQLEIPAFDSFVPGLYR